MAKTKYEIVACVGDPWDYSYEVVDVVRHWKDARRYALLGAKIYLNSKLLNNSRFINHEQVKEAYHDLALDEIVNLDVYCEDSFTADVKRKSAEDVLKMSNLVADEAWKKKINDRYTESLHRDPLAEPLYKRHVQFIPIYSADTHKLVKVINGKVDTDELPF